MTATTALIVAITALAFVNGGNPHPRPWFVFVGVAVVLSILVLGVGCLTRDGLLACGYVALLAGLLLRFSAFSRVLVSGFDHGRWLQYVQRYLDAGSVVGTDMYATSPLYILDLIIGIGVVGGDVFSGRFFTLVLSAVLPLIIGILAFRITDDARLGYAAVVLGMSGPLFLRTATLIESEALAISWFALALYLFLRGIRTRKRRFYGLFLLVSCTAVLLHFFYGIITFLTLLFMSVGLILVRRTGIGDQISTPPANLGVGILTVGVVTVTWILWSAYAHAAAVTLVSATTPTISSDLIGLFLPTTGAAAAGAGVTGEGGMRTTLFTLMPVLSLGLLALVGVGAALSRHPREHVGTIGLASMGALAFGFAIATPDYNLAFRTYYFVSVFLIVFASVAVVHELRASTGRWRSPRTVAVVVLVVSYLFLAPISPIANNVDPRFGGNQWAVTETNIDQLVLLDERFSGTEHVQSQLEQVHPYLLPRVSNENLYMTAATCDDNATVSDVGEYTVCSYIPPPEA